MVRGKPMSRTALVWSCRLLIVAVTLSIWMLLAQYRPIFRFFLGYPPAIAAQVYDWFASGEIYPHLAVTLSETLLSFVIGASLALAVGLWLALSRLWADVFDPFITAVNSMPRLILAPIFSVWFGLGIWSKVALGVTLVFFVVFFSVFQGVREVSPVLLSNMRLLGANARQVIIRLYIPSAMSWVFSSLHLSVGMAFVGAVIGEYLGSSAGVGYLILQAEGSFDIDAVLAGVLTLTVFALILDWLVALVEHRMLRWRRTAGAM